MSSSGPHEIYDLTPQTTSLIKLCGTRNIQLLTSQINLTRRLEVGYSEVSCSFQACEEGKTL